MPNWKIEMPPRTGAMNNNPKRFRDPPSASLPYFFYVKRA